MGTWLTLTYLSQQLWEVWLFPILQMEKQLRESAQSHLASRRWEYGSTAKSVDVHFLSHLILAKPSRERYYPPLRDEQTGTRRKICLWCHIASSRHGYKQLRSCTRLQGTWLVLCQQFKKRFWNLLTSSYINPPRARISLHSLVLEIFWCVLTSVFSVMTCFLC